MHNEKTSHIYQKLPASQQNLNFDQVKYLSADVNYTTIHFLNGRYQIFPYTIKRFEEYLGTQTSQNSFVRIHRQFLVNRQFINEQSDLEVILCCGKVLPVARRRRLE